MLLRLYVCVCVHMSIGHISLTRLITPAHADTPLTHPPDHNPNPGNSWQEDHHCGLMPSISEPTGAVWASGALELIRVVEFFATMNLDTHRVVRARRVYCPSMRYVNGICNTDLY